MTIPWHWLIVLSREPIAAVTQPFPRRKPETRQSLSLARRAGSPERFCHPLYYNNIYNTKPTVSPFSTYTSLLRLRYVSLPVAASAYTVHRQNVPRMFLVASPANLPYFLARGLVYRAWRCSWLRDRAGGVLLFVRFAHHHPLPTHPLSWPYPLAVPTQAVARARPENWISREKQELTFQPHRAASEKRVVGGGGR